MKIFEGKELFQEIERLEDEGIKKIASINIVSEDDGTFDISIWDEIDNERYENLEVGYIASYKEAEFTLDRIIQENQDITFLRVRDQKAAGASDD